MRGPALPLPSVSLHPGPAAGSLQTSTARRPYRGRFAPTPSGPLHDGSVVAALASWLDARAHGGAWLVRMEDIDPPRCQPGADAFILHQLACLGLHPDEPPVWQSGRSGLYAQALEGLQHDALAYPCGCTRRDIAAAHARSGQTAPRHAPLPYPGTCRGGLHAKPIRSWRLHLAAALQRMARAHGAAGRCLTDATPDAAAGTACPAGQAQLFWLHWFDRRLGPQCQQPQRHMGDVVLRRADGLWAYQLAVVVDDAQQGITHIVRGEDLADNTPCQLVLHHALYGPPAQSGPWAPPCYLHTPLVRMPDGEKLSKQHGAPAADIARPLPTLQRAARALGLQVRADGPGEEPGSIAQALQSWVQQWRERYP